MITIINPLTDSRWLSFISGNSGSCIFHHPAWLVLLEKQYGFETKAAVLTENDNITAGIPYAVIKGKKWISLPFSDYCNPLFNSDEQKTLLWSELHDFFGINSVTAEIRWRAPGEIPFASVTEHWLHIKNIEATENELFRSLKTTRVQQPIQKAIKNNLTFETRTDQEAMQYFYRLHLQNRRRLGVPVQPRNYFTHFNNLIIEPGLGFTGLVKKDDTMIAAAIFCGFNQTMTYKYGASDPAYHHLSPNHFMLWKAMLFAKEKGFKVFDFGKTSFSTPGLRDFKAGFGCTESELSFSYFPRPPAKNFMEKTNHYVVKPILKNSPLWVCRFTGELFYKRFGT